MTLEQVAVAAGVPYGTVAAYESGRRTATVDRAAKIAKALDVSIEELTE